MKAKVMGTARAHLQLLTSLQPLIWRCWSIATVRELVLPDIATFVTFALSNPEALNKHCKMAMPTPSQSEKSKLWWFQMIEIGKRSALK